MNYRKKKYICFYGAASGIIGGVIGKLIVRFACYSYLFFDVIDIVALIIGVLFIFLGIVFHQTKPVDEFKFNKKAISFLLVLLFFLWILSICFIFT